MTVYQKNHAVDLSQSWCEVRGPAMDAVCSYTSWHLPCPKLTIETLEQGVKYVQN